MYKRVEELDLSGYEPLKGYENLGYMINIQRGLVINNKRWILARNPVSTGYHISQLPGHGTESVHRLVWRQKYGDIPKDRFVDHIDDNKGNNSINNLQLLTISENTRKAYANKNLKGIRMKAIPIIARNYDTKAETTYESISKAANALEIEPARISSLLRGRGRTVMGRKVRYEFSFVQEPHQRPLLRPEPTRGSVLEAQVPQVLSSAASVGEKPMVKRSIVDWMVSS
jgi:hypothetical protein